MGRPGSRNLSNVKTLTPLAANGAPSERALNAYRLRTERGWTYQRIGEELGVSFGTARNDCEVVERWYLAAGRQKIDGMRVRLESRYDYLYRTAHKAYERSRQPGHSVTTMETAGKPESTVTTETETEHADGNPAWLRIMLECTNRVADLYGVHAPKQPEQPGNLAVNAKVAVILANAPASVLDGIAALAQAEQLTLPTTAETVSNEPAETEHVD